MVRMIPARSLELGKMGSENMHAYSCAWWVTCPFMVAKPMGVNDGLAFSAACEGGIVFW